MITHFRLIILIGLLQLAALRVMAQPKAGFTVSAFSGCSPLAEIFTNATSGGTPPYTYLWKLGNGNISILKDASANYFLPGTYHITLIVTDSKGKTDSVTQSIIVFAKPTASFSAITKAGCAPLSVSFKDLSTGGSGPITIWLWDFGDGTTSSSQNPGGHVYTSPGTYRVSLGVTDANGCKGDTFIPAYIYVDKPPTINFSASAMFGCAPPFKVTFSSTVSPFSSYDTYSWNFGDGTTGTGANPTKTYTTTGNFQVTLTVTDSLGCTTTKTMSQSIYVGKPVASFNMSQTGGCGLVPVSFKNTTNGAPPGSQYSWDFGDGGTSTLSDPAHTFLPGSYTVKLIVKSPGGCSDTVIMKNVIKVSVPYTPRFYTTGVLCQSPFIGTFINETPGAQVVSWDFGDGTSVAGGEDVRHTFPTAGGYFTITLKVVDTDGCVETVTEPDYVHAEATLALFSPEDTTGCVPQTIHFQNLSSSIDPIVSTTWNFGDGTTSNAFTPPPHTYSNPGTYQVTLTVITKQGCKSTVQGKFNFGQKPKANFTSYPDSGCLNMLRDVHFINLTNVGPGAVQADSFWWDFGVGTTSDSELNIRFNDTPGVYEVTLVAYNNKTCPDTLKKEHLIIIKPPWAYYSVIRDTCALQNQLTFIDKSIGATHVEYYFGDGDSSDERDPTHIYTKPGLYYPIQIAYDSSNHCSDTFSYFIKPPILFGLYIKPTWKDSIWPVSDTVGCIPFTVTFKLYDNDSAANYVSFGDGDTAILETPLEIYPGNYTDTLSLTHQYTRPGTYKVYMPAINDQGCHRPDSMIRKIVILGLRTTFSVSQVKGCVPLTVTLTDFFPNDPGVVSSFYDMGNGDIVQDTSRNMTYTYTKPPADQGKGFKITMSKSNISCTDTQSARVFPLQPVAKLYPFNLSSCNSVIYEFVPVVSGGAKPFSYLWDFGNGNTSAVTQPTYIFKTGSYKVILKVTDSIGCMDTISVPIIVPSTSDTANFIVHLSNGDCPPVTADFIDESKFSTTGLHQWYWDFGDGSFSTLENPKKVYYVPGTFTVTLKITDNLGCTSTITMPNIVKIKGPIGSYSFNPNRGCIPVTVHFRAISSDATKFKWDFGDGSPFNHNDTATHVYNNPGTYSPSLIIGDTSCTYGLPPIGDIIVSPVPKADFGYDSTCSGMPITLSDMSTPKFQIVSWAWNLGDGSFDSRQNPTHIYKKNGFYQVTLTVANSAGCTSSITKSVKYGDIIAQFKAPKSICIGSPVRFKDQTLSDSAIKSWLWLFGDGTTSTQQNPVHVYTKKGIFPVSLYVQNYKGCYDSLKDGAYIIIGDTVAPTPPVMYRVSVADDNTVEIDFGKNTDYDFEKYLVYVRDENGNVRLLDSILYADDTIYMERGLNNLHHSYCFLVQAVNVCGYKSDTAASMYHCTINLDAQPGINEAFLTWTPYIGWPVRQYKIYRQGGETPPQFDILDSVPGSQLKYTDTSVVCYRTMDYRVEGLENNGNRQVSWSDTAATTPVHVANVPPADMVRATVENNKTTLVEWQTVPNVRVKNWMVEKSIDGVNFQAMDPLESNVLSKPDQDVNVQTNSYTYRLRILDSCGDIGPYSRIGKTILLHIDTSADVKPELVWSAYKDWPEGVQYYDIDIENAGKGFDWLARTGSGNDTTYIDNITDLNSLPFYTYHVVAHRNGTLSNPDKNINITSMSNDATLRPRSRLYVPNVFTPNGDGINDSFFVQGLYINDFHIKIFDRWGTKVFEAGSMKEKWDGRYKNGPPVMDAYKYLIYYRGVENIDRYAVGWVTILL